MSILPQILRDESGQDIAEYAVMLAVILVLVVGTIRLVGSNANNAFSSVASTIQYAAPSDFNPNEVNPQKRLCGAKRAFMRLPCSGMFGRERGIDTSCPLGQSETRTKKQHRMVFRDLSTLLSAGKNDEAATRSA